MDMVSSEESDEKMDDTGEDGRESGRLKESEKVALAGGVVVEEEKVERGSARRAARNCDTEILAILTTRDRALDTTHGNWHPSYAFHGALLASVDGISGLAISVPRALGTGKTGQAAGFHG